MATWIIVGLLVLIWRNTYRSARAAMGRGNPRFDRAFRWWLDDQMIRRRAPKSQPPARSREPRLPRSS